MNITTKNGSWHSDFRDITFQMPNVKGKHSEGRDLELLMSNKHILIPKKAHIAIQTNVHTQTYIKSAIIIEKNISDGLLPLSFYLKG